MRLLDRYLLRELLIPLGYCLGGFLIFWIAFDLFSELGHMQSLKLHAGDIAKYYAVKTPEFLVVVLPIGLLLALLYTLTNHARHHEITAIRAAGVSLWRLCLPYLAVGFAASLFLFALNELYVPDSAETAARILNCRIAPQASEAERYQVHDFGFKNETDGRFWIISNYNLKTFEMSEPHVDWRSPDGLLQSFGADRAIRTNGCWIFFNVHEFRESGQPNSPFVPWLQTNVLAMPAFTETPEEIQSEINIRQSLGVRTKNRADVPVAQIVDYLRLHPRPAKWEHRAWLYTKLHGRLAAPWTCLVVVLIAIPFSAASGRRNVFVGVAGSIFICFAYFVLLQFGLALGTGGYVPAWLAAWFPNLTFGIAGVWLTARVR
jgi:lipopolysaccharide export system permease protein